jgi:transglutaminase-like putative cysteine protease
MKGRGVDATLAAMATLTAAWPVSTLLDEPTWLGGTLLLLAVIAVSGVGARSLALRGWQVLMVQLACAVLTAGGIYGQGHLWHGLPTFETLGFAGKLVDEALTTVQTYAAPAPTTPGLAFVVGCALALVALAVDYLAVTRRSPSLAGLPLLTVFLSAAANSDSSLPFVFFLAAGAMWLLLVARQGSAILRRWATTVAVARTPARESLDSDGGHGYASMARTLGAMALVAAVGLPVVLPQLPPKFLLSGLGRSPSASGNGSGTVGFSLNLDVASDLRSQSTTPVLQYRTTDTSPPPLRVTVNSFYDSDSGRWRPRGEPSPSLSHQPAVPEPTGLSAETPKKRFTTTFEHNRLEEPNLATPYPLISADLEGIRWGLDDQTQDVRVAERPSSYAVSYWRLEPTTAMLKSASPIPADGDISALSDDLVTSVGPSGESIRALSIRLTADEASTHDKAMAIQQYLRTGGFTYSLNLAPPTKDRSGNDEHLDPLTHFLVTKQGYCVQFATAMVELSRAAGIPARMAIGFLPGTLSDGVWTVTAADAHTWPELYLDGLGWTRFEPTPSRGAPPVWAIPPASNPTRPDADPRGKTTAPVPPKSERPDPGGTAPGGSASPDVGLSLTSVLRWLTHGWGLVLLASLAGLFGSLVVPTAARWRRRSGLSTARTSAHRVEVQWELLTSSLGDLGIARAPSRTPRQLRVYYEREAFLEGAASEALGRVVQTLERSRYAVSAPVPDGLAADARQVLRAAAATRRRSARFRAALWPSGGLAQLRATREWLAWSVRAPLRDVSAIVRQWFPHRR